MHACFFLERKMKSTIECLLIAAFNAVVDETTFQVVLSYIPFHSERKTMAMTSLYHLVKYSLSLSSNLGEILMDGPLMVIALICSVSAFWAVVAWRAVVTCRAETDDLSCVMVVEFCVNRLIYCLRISTKEESMIGGGVDCGSTEIGTGMLAFVGVTDIR